MKKLNFCNICSRPILHSASHLCLECKAKREINFELTWNLKNFNDNVVYSFLNKLNNISTKQRL